VACAATVSLLQDAFLLGVFPGSTYDVYVQPNTDPAPTTLPTPLVADTLGVAAGAFLLTVPSSATSIVLSVYLTPGGPPALASASFTSRLAAALTCVPGGPRAAVRLLAKLVQEQTGCPGGTPGTWRELVDVALTNADSNAGYDVYIRPNNGTAGGFVSAGALTTNAQGNAGAILPVMVATTGAAPTAVDVVAVPSGMPATAAAAFTFAATPAGDPTTSTLITVSCVGAITAAIQDADGLTDLDALHRARFDERDAAGQAEAAFQVVGQPPAQLAHGGVIGVERPTGDAVEGGRHLRHHFHRVERPLAVEDDLIKGRDTTHTEQHRLHLGGVDVDATDDQHVVVPPAQPSHAHTRSPARARFGDEGGDVAGAVADERVGLFRQRGEDEFALLAGR
jgi:hypothetical protein